MPYAEPDATDPMELVGVALPASGPDAMRELCACVADEFARMGCTAEEILGLFRSPFYAVAHGAWQALGDRAVEEQVLVATKRWGRPRAASGQAHPTGAERAAR